MKKQSLKNSEAAPEINTVSEQYKVITAIPHFGSYSMVIGVLLLVIGGVGMLLPQLMSLEVTLLIGILLIAGGFAWMVYAFRYSVYSWADWLKPVLLFVTGGLMLFYPMNGVAVIGLLLAIYLMLDAFGSFILARTIYPHKGWGWMAFNGVTSVLLVMLFLVGWPDSSLFIVGLYIAISLFFDGWALLYLGWMHGKLRNKK